MSDFKNIKFLTVETAAFHHEFNLLQSARLNEIEIEVLGKGEEWDLFVTKLLILENKLKEVKEDYICFTDSRDVLFLNGENHIWDVYQKNWKGKVVFNAEQSCWPYEELSKDHPPNDSTWKFLNSGCYIGPRFLIGEIIKKCIKIYNDTNEKNDQPLFQKVFLNDTLGNAITLDYECKLFQSLSGDIEDITFNKENIYNKSTKTYPSIIHGNGKVNMTKVANVLVNKFQLNSIEDIFNKNLL